MKGKEITECENEGKEEGEEKKIGRSDRERGGEDGKVEK